MAFDKKNVNPEQFEAIIHGDGPLLIIAGAGTGKTTVITERIKYLILKKNIPPSEILALTFTEKASREMEERVDIAMPYDYSQMWISTFHALCDRILRSEAIHIGLNPAYKLMLEAETIQFLRKHIFEFDLTYFRPLGNPGKFLQGMLQHFSRLHDEDISPIQYHEWAQTQNSKLKTQKEEAEQDEIKKTKELVEAFKKYEELKIKEGVMDFSDLISNTLLLFRTRKNVLRKYQNTFKYILVDEFQDTNFAQNTLSIMLAGKKKNITVVGDDDQAIYRWRGAAISNIVQFRTQFPNAKIITLTKNYRSTQEILDSSYTLIQNNNPDRLEVKEKINKKLESARKEKGKAVEFLFAQRVEDEAENTIKKIEELVENKQHQYSDMAILVRANDYSQPFVRTLNRYNIPFQFLGPGQLFRQEEIKDLIAYLKVLCNFEDSTCLYRVLNMSIFSLEPRDISALLNFARRKNYTLFEAIEKIVELHLGGVAKRFPRGGRMDSSGINYEIFLKDATLEGIKIIHEMILKHLKLVSKSSAGQILYYFMENSGLLKKFLSAKTEIEVKRYQNIARFFDKLKSYEAEHENVSVFAVTDWIDLSMQLGESPLATDTDWTENNAVNILTIHSSKGLEFPVVFLVNLVSQRFPTRERREQIPISEDLIKEILPQGDFHIQEERRLFYVGMTRAKNLLCITAAHFYGEGKRERKLSPFVYEVFGKEYVDSLLKKEQEKQITYQPSLLEWSQSPSEQSPHLQSHSHLSPPTPNPISPISYISYSQIHTYEICPLHYKLRYILKVPGQPTPAQSFGTSVHSALRDFYADFIKDNSITASHIRQTLKNGWISSGYESKAHEKQAFQKAVHILDNYLKKYFSPKANVPIALETPFQFSIKDSQLRPQGLKIGGRIDRIDKIINSKIEILDYKTGSNVPGEKELTSDLQLAMYGLAACFHNTPPFNRKPEDIVLSLYYLEEDIKLSTTRTLEELEECKKLIFEKVAEIEKSDFLCSHSHLCQNCEYKMLCQV